MALTAAALALTLAACGSSTGGNAAAANDVTLNDTIVPDETADDADPTATGNGAGIAPVDPLADQNATAPLNAQ